MEVKGKKVI